MPARSWFHALLLELGSAVRAYIAWIGLSIVAIGWGGQNIARGLAQRAPVALTCAEYLAHPPDAVWLKLRQCEPDFRNAYVIRDRDRTVKAVYVPVRAPGTSAGPPRLLFQYDGDLSAAAWSATVWSGSLRVGAMADIDAGFRRELTGALGATPDFAILALGEEPSLFWGMAALLGGLLSTTLIFLWMRKGIRLRLISGL